MNIVPKSLFGRINVTLFLLIAALVSVQSLILVRSYRYGLFEALQAKNWDLAQQYADFLQPLLARNASDEEVAKQIHALEKLHPGVEAFLLDKNGIPLVDGNGKAFSRSHPWNGKKQVPVTLLESFLRPQANRPLPLLGPELHPWIGDGRKVIFSAARFEAQSIKYYVYVVLWNAAIRSSATGLTDNLLLQTGSMWSLIATIISALLGGFAVYLLTRRFRQVTSVVHAIAEGNLTARIPATSSDSDEVGELAKEINQMADTIVSKIDELASTDQMRRQLVATITHDIGKPIAAMRAYLDTSKLRDRALSAEETTTFFDITERNLNRLERLVSDLFELSKLETNEQKIEEIPFNFAELLEGDLLPHFAPLAERADISLTSSADTSNTAVIGDPGLIERVLVNLLENAIHYNTAGGSVTVTIRRDGDYLCIEVADTGSGISPEELPQLFEGFFRGAEHSGSIEGSGLGLAIVKKILELHEQSIYVESELGKGSRFWFKLPYA